MILSTTWSEVILLHFISFVKNTDKDELIETYIFYCNSVHLYYILLLLTLNVFLFW